MSRLAAELGLSGHAGQVYRGLSDVNFEGGTRVVLVPSTRELKFECPVELLPVEVKLHSKRVKKIQNFTQCE